MKTYILIIFSLFISSVTFAQYRQDTTTLYVNPGYNKDPMRSKWNGKVEQKGEFWELSLRDKKGVLREKICFEDKKLEVRKGPYAFYENGIVKEEGNYEKGYRNGIWKSYHEKGQLSERVNYWYGKLAGPYTSFWENGKPKAQGKYSNNNKVGSWEIYYSDAKLALREIFGEDGKLTDQTYFDKEGNPIIDKSIIPSIQ